MTPTRARALLIGGLVLMVAGAIDPLEGSLVILVGGALAAGAAWFGRLPGTRSILISFAVMVLGIAAMWGLSDLGGFGGTSGRSMWWGVTILPYPVGWIGAVAAAIVTLRATRRSAAPRSRTT